MAPVSSGYAEIFCRKAEQVAQLANIRRIERFVASESGMPQARQVEAPAELVLDLSHELLQRRSFPIRRSRHLGRELGLLTVPSGRSGSGWLGCTHLSEKSLQSSYLDANTRAFWMLSRRLAPRGADPFCLGLRKAAG